MDIVGDLKRDLLDVRIFCGRYFPFVVIPLSYTRILSSMQVPTAGVDEAGQIIINPVWWNALTKESKRFVAIHECLHLVLCHPFRAQNFNHTIYNNCADGKNNHAITQANIDGITFQNNELVTLYDLANLTKLSIETLQKMSTEEITNTIQQQLQQNIQTPNQNPDTLNGGLHSSTDGSGFGSDLVTGQFEGELVQKGDSTVFSESSSSLSSSVCLSSERLLATWRQLCEKARAFAVQAGVFPASLERVVSEVLEVKPPWRTTVRFGLRSGLVFDSSFAYPNRRNDTLPGSVGYSSVVWLLVDRLTVEGCCPTYKWKHQT